MGKNSKKDPEKKFALQAKKDAKADKKAQKRLRKEQSGNNNVDEIENKDLELDALLDAYKRQTLELRAPIIQYLDNPDMPFPYPPRGNFTLTLCPNSGEFMLFGGEYYNGVENTVFDELLCFNPDAMKSSSSTQKAWKRILSSPRPPARCSHTTVFYNNALYVFGGELATAENYHHYKDFWMFDIKSNTWTELKPRTKTCPSPRSGHRAVVWRHYMILFGGFYEAAREAPRWYNDLYIYDFSSNTWTECTYSKLATLPPERSAFNFSILSSADVAFVSGGYSKLKNPTPGTKAEGRVYTDCWALHLKGFESCGRIPTWERLPKKGEYPSQRSGTSCTVWKNNMLVFGGVQDEECDNHKVDSIFFDDLFAFDMERKRWFALKLKKQNSGRRRRKKATDNENIQEQELMNYDDQGVNDDASESEESNSYEGEAISSGWNLDKLKSNMFAFLDGDGNIVYEKIEADNSDVEDSNDGDEIGLVSTSLDTKSNNNIQLKSKTSKQRKSKKLDHHETTPKSDPVVNLAFHKQNETPSPRYGPASLSPLNKSEVMLLNQDGKPQPVSRDVPVPRIGAQIVTKGYTMFLYGGILEVGDREITLDDCWSIDLMKREKWNCIWSGTMHQHIWKGVAESDNDSYISTGKSAGENESEEEEEEEDELHEFDETNEKESETEKEDANNDDDDLQVGEVEAAATLLAAQRKAEKKAAKKEKMRSIHEEMAILIDHINNQDVVINDDFDNTVMLPLVDEEFEQYYSRTMKYWKSTVEVGSNENHDEETLTLERSLITAKDYYNKKKQYVCRLNELKEYLKAKEERKLKKSNKSKKKKTKKQDREND